MQEFFSLIPKRKKRIFRGYEHFSLVTNSHYLVTKSGCTHLLLLFFVEKATEYLTLDVMQPNIRNISFLNLSE
jgi:hypothetical protein